MDSVHAKNTYAKFPYTNLVNNLVDFLAVRLFGAGGGGFHDLPRFLMGGKYGDLLCCHLQSKLRNKICV